MNPPVITCSGVTKNFGETEVLKGIDLEIPHGSIVGLLGTNGSGKSTLIKCLLGLLKISSGAATVCGEDPWDLSAETKSQLGYVPQEIKLYPWMRVRQVIDYTGAFYENWDAEHCKTHMELWELDGSKWIKTLSGVHKPTRGEIRELVRQDRRLHPAGAGRDRLAAAALGAADAGLDRHRAGGPHPAVG